MGKHGNFNRDAKNHGTVANLEATTSQPAAESKTANMTREELLAAFARYDPEGIESHQDMADTELRELVGYALEDPDADIPDVADEVVADHNVEESVEKFPVVEDSSTTVEDESTVVEDKPLVQEMPKLVAETPAPPVVEIQSLSDAARIIAQLRQDIAAIQAAGKGGRKVASGSKPRPNVVYTLLDKPPQWHSTPQVAQLQQILFDPKVAAKHTVADGEKKVVKLTEPELFELVNAGQQAGVLRTRQPAVRIFQYYRTDLLKSNSIRWS